MHGLFNRAIQSFLTDTYGLRLWASVAQAANAPPEGFETLRHYPESLTLALIDASAGRLRRTPETLLEDLGIYLMSHPTQHRLRRLMRFGGVDFIDFLHSLEDLPGRARLALADLDLPELALVQTSANRYLLHCTGPGRLGPAFGHVLAGLLRTMADEYGALVVLEHDRIGNNGAMLAIDLPEPRFAKARRFALAL